MKKIIFILGGVVSSLGKGIVSSSICALLNSSGYSVLPKKVDPYLNIDPGTLSPYEHGEVFVTRDGGETDLDLGHYERFTGQEITKISSITAGSIYNSVLKRERQGEYKGKTTQLVPHVTNEIINRFVETDKDYDFIVVEVGGTVGDLESQIFLEAIRQMKSLDKNTQCMVIHTALLPVIKVVDEIKTKPIQHSVSELHASGIHPDSLVLRFEHPISRDSKEIIKISNLTGVSRNNIFVSHDVDSIYSVPLVLNNQGILKSINSFFALKPKNTDLNTYEKFKKEHNQRKTTKKIGIIGKYSKVKDSYLSIAESLIIGSTRLAMDLDIKWIDSENLKPDNCEKIISELDGIIIAPGFGERGTKGKLNACKYARENNIPTLGICFGMQIIIIEFLRNVCNEHVTSLEFEDSNTIKKHAITVLDGREEKKGLGGTLRLGNYDCDLLKNSKTSTLYSNQKTIKERHRHRYEVNNDYRKTLEENGMKVAGVNKKNNLIEIVELTNHPFYISCQFHPEFKTNLFEVHPLFSGFLKSIIK